MGAILYQSLHWFILHEENVVHIALSLPVLEQAFHACTDILILGRVLLGQNLLRADLIRSLAIEILLNKLYGELSL